jgi:alkanesulfonate monooxygenase SsuD/methylene tetrahydromethanopterin reductase-like flavin-dependent oxidoreductase (luciferase family)
MDRISAIRNVEEALRAFEAGEADLAATEERVVTVLRTYATEFEGEAQAELSAYRARGEAPADGTVVVAATPAEARERIRNLIDDGDGVAFEVDPL